MWRVRRIVVVVIFFLMIILVLLFGEFGIVVRALVSVLVIIIVVSTIVSRVRRCSRLRSLVKQSSEVLSVFRQVEEETLPLSACPRHTASALVV